MLIEKPKHCTNAKFKKHYRHNAKVMLYIDETAEIITVRHNEYVEKRLRQAADVMHKLLNDELVKQNIYVYAYEYIGPLGPCAFICCKSYETEKDYLDFQKYLKKQFRSVRLFMIKGDML